MGKNSTPEHFRHNNISGASNATVQAGDEGRAVEDMVIENNLLSGGGYTLNIRCTGATVPKNTRVINNRFVHDSAYSLGPSTIRHPPSRAMCTTMEGLYLLAYMLEGTLLLGFGMEDGKQFGLWDWVV